MHPTTCPHGNHQASTTPHAELRHICAVCGGPRIPTSAPTSGSELGALRAAKDAYTRRTSWRFGSGCSAILATLGGIVGLALLRLDSVVATTVAIGFLVAAFPFALVFVTGLAKASRYSKDLAKELAEAWRRAVRDVARNATGPLHTAEFARQLDVSEDDADRFLAELSAEGLLRSEVTEAGQVVYRPATRARIAADASSAHGERGPDALGVAPTAPGEPGSPEDADLEARFAELARREAGKPR